MGIKLKIERGLVLLAVALILASSLTVRCARQAAPIGGPKDTIPPILKKISPHNYATNFKKGDISFEFNEFMQLKDVSKDVTYSPPLNTKPQVLLRGKKIITKFTEDIVLDSNTTYRIDYGNALRDNNEGNPAQQIAFVFSTGDKIDSLSMSGLVVNAVTGDTVRRGLVLMYDDFPDTVKIDSTIFTGKIKALFRTDSSGVFFASNLKAKPYRVYVLEDNDNNNAYSVGKDNVGFYPTALNPAEMAPFSAWFDPISRKVNASPQVTIRTFNERRVVNQNITDISRPQKYRIQVIFNAYDPDIDTVFINGIPASNIIEERSLNADTVSYWIKGNGIEIPDTLIGEIGFMGSKDSLGNPKVIFKKFMLSFYDPDAIVKKKAKINKAGKPKVSFFKRLVRWFQFKKRKAEKRAAKARMAEIATFDSTALERFKIDSIRLDSLKLDSIAKSKIAPDSMRNLKLYINPTSNYNPNDAITLKTDYPIDSIYNDRISLYSLTPKKRGEDYFDAKAAAKGINTDFDRVKESVSFIKDSVKATIFHIKAPWKADTDYELIFDPSAFVDILGERNDSITHKFKTIESRKMTTLIFNVTGASGCYIFDLLDIKGGKVERSFKVSKDTVYKVDLLPVKTYRLRIIHDKDCNGVMNMGNLVKREQPEDIGFFINEKKSVLIDTKENFEIPVNVDLGKIFVSKNKKEDE